MQITKELMDNEIALMQARLKETEASVNKLTGALVTLQDFRAYLDREEPVAAVNVPSTEISPENAEIQARDEHRAISIQELAEMVAGPGAIAEEPQPIYDFPYDYQDAEEEGLDNADR